MKTFKSEEGKQAIYESYDKLLCQWDIEVEEIDVPGKYGTTHIVMAGDKKKPPLMLFHGVGDNSALMWIYNAKRLSENFCIYAVDAIGGAGKSIAGNGYGKNFSQSEWVRELMDSLDIEKACAAGVSYGCYLVQLLLVELPERIIKAIGMSGSIAAEGSKNNSFRMMRAFMPEALFPTDKNVAKLIKKLTGDNSSEMISNKELMNHWKLLLRNFNNMSMGYHAIKKFPINDIDKINPKLRLLIGDRDILSYYPDSIEMLDKTKIDYKIIQGAGHAINHELHKEINEMILEFLL